MRKSLTDRIAYRLNLDIPSCNFKLLKGVHDIFTLSESIIYRLKYPEDCSIYDQSHIAFIKSIWDYFEIHFHHLLGQIRFVLMDNNNDYWSTPFSLHYSISQSIVIEIHIIRAVLYVIKGDSGETPFFADKRDLLLYYSKALDKELGIEHIVGNEKLLEKKWPLDNIPDSKESDGNYSINYNTDIFPDFGDLIIYNLNEAKSASKTMKELVGSELSLLLVDLGLANDCDYCLTRNSKTIKGHISRIRHSWDYKTVKLQIMERSKTIYNDLRSEFILNHHQITDTQIIELKRIALQNALREKWPETSKSYEDNHHHIDVEDSAFSGYDGIKEWMRKFMRNTYSGEQRDGEGNLIDVKLDEMGRTTIEGKSGWERWIELVTIAAISEEAKAKNEDEEEDVTVPEILRSEKATMYKLKLVEAGMIADNWQPIALSRTDKGELAMQLAIRLNISNVWKLFGKLWNIEPEQLRTAFNKGREQNKNSKLQEKIKNVLD